MLAGQLLAHGGGVTGGMDFVAEATQVVAEQGSDVGVVVDQKEGGFGAHGAVRGSPCGRPSVGKAPGNEALN